jgi:hypothetical protein
VKLRDLLVCRVPTCPKRQAGRQSRNDDAQTDLETTSRDSDDDDNDDDGLFISLLLLWLLLL